MKKLIKLITIFAFSTLPIFAAEPELQNIFRGIDFSVTEVQKVQSMSITVPKIAKRFDSIHNTDKYPIAFFKADCTQEKECFSLLISVMAIPDSLKSYETLLQESKTKDFGSTPYEMNKWMELISFKTDKTMILFGPGELLGNKINAFYYIKDTKETYKVSINLIYHPNFQDEEWKSILLHSFLIIDSISIK
ncbi:hypothetical protein EHQ30_06510 [Leptospira brenneri]|uniref:Permease n=1 Tax=Leptospira brenneri TaxID=2023182 RepID=A0A5F1ZBJ1_9LEPT|nr:hypothetical protein [Leptospira brenneri]TGK96253.1 hypothetical protein EHQ30_06510 [Leptospira brenneri]